RWSVVGSGEHHLRRQAGGGAGPEVAQGRGNVLSRQQHRNGATRAVRRGIGRPQPGGQLQLHAREVQPCATTRSAHRWPLIMSVEALLAILAAGAGISLVIGVPRLVSTDMRWL